MLQINNYTETDLYIDKDKLIIELTNKNITITIREGIIEDEEKETEKI